MGDNTSLKDAGELPYSLRAIDISTAQDGSLRRTLLYASLMPLDYAGVGGGFHHTSKGGVMAAGLAANSTIYAFQNPSTSVLALVRRIRIAAWSLSVGFTAGLATFDVIVARPFTALDTGGSNPTMTTPQMKLRTSLGTPVSQIARATTGSLTPGTRTLDVGAMESWTVGAPTTSNTPFNATPVAILSKPVGELPLVLGVNEGFVVQATVPATGTWQFSLCVEWDEVPTVQFKT